MFEGSSDVADGPESVFLDNLSELSFSSSNIFIASPLSSAIVLSSSLSSKDFDIERGIFSSALYTIVSSPSVISDVFDATSRITLSNISFSDSNSCSSDSVITLDVAPSASVDSICSSTFIPISFVTSMEIEGVASPTISSDVFVVTTLASTKSISSIFSDRGNEVLSVVLRGLSSTEGTFSFSTTLKKFSVTLLFVNDPS